MKKLLFILSLIITSSCSKVEDLIPEKKKIDPKYYEVHVYSDSSVFSIKINRLNRGLFGDTTKQELFIFTGVDSLSALEFERINGSRTEVTVKTKGVTTIVGNAQKI